MKRTTPEKILLFVFAILFTVAMTKFFSNTVTSEYDELGSKPEYAAMQGIASTDVTGDVDIMQIQDYWIAGFPDYTGEGSVWVLLNAQHSPYYKQIPQANFFITEQILQKIRETGKASYTVLSVLKTHTKKDNYY